MPDVREVDAMSVRETPELPEGPMPNPALPLKVNATPLTVEILNEAIENIRNNYYGTPDRALISGKSWELAERERKDDETIEDAVWRLAAQGRIRVLF